MSGAHEAWWARWVDLGVSPEASLGEARRLRLTNAISWVVAATIVPFLVMFAWISPALGVLTAVMMALVVATPLLNAQGHTDASRALLMFVQPTSIGLYAELLGRGMGLENMLFGASLLPLLIFPPRRVLPVALGVTYAWGYRVALHVTGGDLFGALGVIPLDEAARGPLSLLFVFVTLFLLTVVVTIPVFLQDRAQEDLVARNEELRAERIARNEADARSASKTRFLANMSHELRTPLHTIIGYAEMVDEAVELGELDTDEVRADLRRIHAAGSHMLEVISDVLDLSRIESGRVEIHPARVDLGELVDELAGHGAALADNRSNGFELVTGELPAEIETDAVRLRQIVLNLLSNAAKFTDQGHVTMRVEADGESLRFEVEDTGPGIPADRLEAIFEVFERVEVHKEGAGLGLAVSRELAHMLGGTLTATSELGVGSRFTLTLEAPS
jgi:signal transduction histidine kinase